MKLTQNLRNVIERKILCMAAHSAKNIDNMFRLRRKETKELGICVGRLSIELGYVAVKMGLQSWSENRYCSAYKLINVGCDGIVHGLKLQERNTDAKYIKEHLQKYCESIVQQCNDFKYNN